MSAQPASLGSIPSRVSRDLRNPERLALLAETASERSHPTLDQQPPVPKVAIDEHRYAR
jgi:hypothetical protein